MNEYQQREYNKKLEVLNELNNYGGVYRFELEENKTEPERGIISLTGLIPISVNYQDYQKKYSFYLNHNLPYVKYDTQKQVSEKYTKPQEVGVLNTNKIKAWVEYLIKIYQDMIEISKERVLKIDSFEKQAREAGATIGKKDTYYGTFSGQIVKNGIEFEFSIQDEGYISQEIKVYYKVSDTIENFLALADNQYRKTE